MTENYQKTTIQEFRKESQTSSNQTGADADSTANLRRVPEHWDHVPFQYWAEKKNEKGDGKERNFITLEHINSVTGDLVDDFEWELRESDDYYLFESGDVLFGKLRPYLRKYYQTDRAGCCGTDLMVLRPRRGVDADYLYYFLHSEDFIQYTEANSHGVKMPRISWK